MVGLCCGETAAFNSGSTVVVRTSANSGTTGTTGTTGGPNCLQVGYTAESNNLSWVSPCSGTGAIVFTETNVPPIPGCSYSNAVTTCVAETGSNDNISEDTYTVTCPTSSLLSMQRIKNDNNGIGNGMWASLPQHCSDGSVPGTCSPSAIVPNEFVLGTQKYGVTLFGGAEVGTTQTVEVCDSASQCSQFQLTIPQCPPLHSANDQLTADNISIVQGGPGWGRLFMNGPWVATDHGTNAQGKILSWNLPPGCTGSLSPGYPNTSGGVTLSGGFMEVNNASCPLSASPGTYTATVQVKDLATGITNITPVPISIFPCEDSVFCGPNNVGGSICGPVLTGCGKPFDCGACGPGLSCTGSYCCVPGEVYDISFGECLPSSCPPGTSLCMNTLTCTTQGKCKPPPPNCFKVNGCVAALRPGILVRLATEPKN